MMNTEQSGGLLMGLAISWVICFHALMQITAAQFEQLYQDSAKKLYRVLRARFPGFNHQDLQDVMQETFRGLWKSSTENKLDSSLPLEQQLWGIGKNRGVDLARNRKRKSGNVPLPEDEDDLSRIMADALEKTNTARSLNAVRENEETEEMRREFGSIVNSCKGNEREVGRVWADELDNEIDNAGIADILTRAGKPTSVTQVKTAKAALRQKFQELLNRKARKDK